MPIPNTPVRFIKIRTSLAFSANINTPKIAQENTAEYEAKLTVIFFKDGRDILESEASNYLLANATGNDVSASAQQLKNNQWSFGKGKHLQKSHLGDHIAANSCLQWSSASKIKLLGVDGAAPISSVRVSPEAIPDL